MVSVKAYYNETVETVRRDLNGEQDFLTNEEVKRRQEKFGFNELAEGKKKSGLQIFLEQYKDFLVLILIVSAVVSLFLGETESAAVILVVIVASLMSLPVPFAPVHLLFINLLTDSLPAIALGLEPYHHDVMGEKPRPVKESILTKDFLTRIGVEGGVIGAVVLAGFVLLTVVLTVPALHGFFVVQTLKMGELLTVYGLSGLSMLVIQGLKQVVKF
mgnify:CR=1 FL=1